MQYSEYHQRDLTIRAKMTELQEKYQESTDLLKEERSSLASEYLGDFAAGKAVKYENSKYFVQAGFQSILDNRTAVTIRKAKKDGNPSVNGLVYYFVETSNLEAWNEL